MESAENHSSARSGLICYCLHNKTTSRTRLADCGHDFSVEMQIAMRGQEANGGLEEDLDCDSVDCDLLEYSCLFFRILHHYRDNSSLITQADKKDRNQKVRSRRNMCIATILHRASN